jgi:hypothetical protein
MDLRRELQVSYRSPKSFIVNALNSSNGDRAERTAEAVRKNFNGIAAALIIGSL